MNEITENIFNLSLSEIASWQIESLYKDGGIHATIPTFQRGLVWNPAQIEVLWDSLMRGIPIGAISLLKNDDSSYFIIDGQQRSNAITMGFNDLPPNSNNPILWIDLLPDEGLKKRSNRKFFFYVTTPGQPWGYKINDANGENKNERLNTEKRRAFINELLGDTEKLNLKNKPLTSNCWPHDACFPVPFSKLRQLINEGYDYDFNKLCQLCPKKNKGSIKEDNIKKEIDKIKKALKNVDNTKVTALVAPHTLIADENNGNEIDSTEDTDSEIAVFFARLNRGGTLPSREDLNYSILKSINCKLAEIDDLAKNFIHPAALANIAMMIYLSNKEKDKWIKSVSRKKVFELGKDKEFIVFIKNFKKNLNNLKTLVTYSQENELGIPMVVYSRWLKNKPNLFRFLYTQQDNFQKDKKLLISIATLLAWFGNDDKINYNQNFDIKKLKEWLLDEIQKGNLLIPAPSTEFENNAKIDNLEEILSYRDKLGWLFAINYIWHWESANGRDILLYACRKYLDNIFREYDPASILWSEDNRPWDYDHIFPKNWLITGKGNRHGKNHIVIEKYINSIGNIAPIPFSINRSKNNDAPGKYQEENNQLLFVKYSNFFEDKHTDIENDDDKSLRFTQIVAQRFYDIYKEWYEKLNINDLLDFSKSNDKRSELLKEIKNNEMEIYYVVDINGLQHKLEENVDWARPWLAVGRETYYEKNNKCLLCIASDGNRWEVGYRRHPDCTEINGDSNRWWFKCDVFNNSEDAKNKFKDLCKQNFIKEYIAETYDALLNEIRKRITGIAEFAYNDEDRAVHLMADSGNIGDDKYFVRIYISLWGEALNQHQVCQCGEKIGEWTCSQETTSHRLVFTHDADKEFVYKVLFLF